MEYCHQICALQVEGDLFELRQLRQQWPELMSATAALEDLMGAGPGAVYLQQHHVPQAASETSQGAVSTSAGAVRDDR